MEKIKEMVKKSVLIFGLFFIVENSYSQTISNHFFGENAWMPDTIGNAKACQEPPCILNGKLYEHWDDIKSSNASVIRFGGIAADRNMPTNYQYIRMIDSIRSNGMEPIIQVPFHMNRYSAQQAADIVRYINITKGKKIKYWVIGNEPDLGYSYTKAAQIAAYFKPFASAMKAVDPSILTVGPECAWFNQSIINGLTNPNGPDDITGKDASGRYYLDIISFHTYPFNGSQTRDQIISKLTSTGSLQDNLVYLNSRIAACNSTHGRTGASALKTAITEANINWQNNSGDNLNGTGANSFIGGQFIAEMMCVGMKNGVDFINLWSVVEGNSTALNIGYIDPTTSNKKPGYYHFKLLAENFKGSFANGTSNKSNVKSYGSKNGQQVSVLIMNQDLSSSYNYALRLDNSTVSGSNSLKINIDAGVAKQYDDVIPSQSTVLLIFNSNGALIKKYEYSLTVQAIANQPPTITNYQVASNNNPGTGERPSQEFSGLDNFEVNVFPNPSAGKFVIESSNANNGEQEYEAKLFNIMGQEVYNRKSVFQNGKDEIELDPDIASGEYILRVKENRTDIYSVEKIVIQK